MCLAHELGLRDTCDKTCFDLVANRTRSAFTQRLRDVSGRFRHTLSRIHCTRGVLYCVDRTSRLYPIIHAAQTYMVCN